VWPLPDHFALALVGPRAFLEEEAWARSNTDLQAKVFLVGGDAEETSGGGWHNNPPDEIDLQLRQLTNMRKLNRRLAARNYPNLRFKTALIPDGHHITVVPAAVALGLVEVVVS